MKNKKYIQYGCGDEAPKEWINFDASPTLRIQKIPIIGRLLRSKLNLVFPNNVYYGDIIKGLPIKEKSVDGIYCSHILEHLSLHDFRNALNNTYNVMKDGAIFRCVVPDLEKCAKKYIEELSNGNNEASISFLKTTSIGIEKRPRGIVGFVTSFFGNSQHLWMWDRKSLSLELEKAGFKEIRECKFNDSEDIMFSYVENESRYNNAVSIECKK